MARVHVDPASLDRGHSPGGQLEPTAFIKINSCLSGYDAKVVRPEGVVRLDYEPEMAFVIGKPEVAIRKEDAMEYVAGLTLLNDLTCRDLQEREVAAGSRFWTDKNIPGFGPLALYIITLDEVGDPHNLRMTCTVNGVQPEQCRRALLKARQHHRDCYEGIATLRTHIVAP